MTGSVDISRRALLAGGGAFASMFVLGGAAVALEGNTGDSLLRPPGAQDAARFYATCLKCNRCETVCPQHCIRTGILEDGILNWRTPIMNFHRGLCDFCGKCEQVCPSGSIVGASDTTSVIGIAEVNHERCIAWIQGGCQVCSEACVYEAITLDDSSRPVVDAQKCNGCGACEYVCPSNSYLSFAGGSERGINVRVQSERDANE